MKIKNFKINLDAIRSKFCKKIKSFVLAGSIAATILTGCGEKTKSSLLEGTILEGASVVTFDDGSKDIVTTIGACDSFSNDNGDSFHYCSIITGERYSDEKCTAKKPNGKILKHYPIDGVSSIASYLIQGEITKAINGELDDEDIIVIISRVIEPTTELEQDSEVTLEKTIN